jgi:hypothetical protein
MLLKYLKNVSEILKVSCEHAIERLTRRSNAQGRGGHFPERRRGGAAGGAVLTDQLDAWRATGCYSSAELLAMLSSGLNVADVLLLTLNA